MFLTVTLNPAVDRNCEIDVLKPGEVNRLTKSGRTAGGKGINVTKILRQFHMPVAAVGFLGGSGGRLIEDAMERLGVEGYFTRIKGGDQDQRECSVRGWHCHGDSGAGA